MGVVRDFRIGRRRVEADEPWIVYRRMELEVGGRGGTEDVDIMT